MERRNVFALDSFSAFRLAHSFPNSSNSSAIYAQVRIGLVKPRPYTLILSIQNASYTMKYRNGVSFLILETFILKEFSLFPKITYEFFTAIARVR